MLNLNFLSKTIAFQERNSKTPAQKSNIYFLILPKLTYIQF